jgi:hypothetical protein
MSSTSPLAACKISGKRKRNEFEGEREVDESAAANKMDIENEIKVSEEPFRNYSSSHFTNFWSKTANYVNPYMNFFYSNAILF